MVATFFTTLSAVTIALLVFFVLVFIFALVVVLTWFVVSQWGDELERRKEIPEEERPDDLSPDVYAALAGLALAYAALVGFLGSVISAILNGLKHIYNNWQLYLAGFIIVILALLGTKYSQDILEATDEVYTVLIAPVAHTIVLPITNILALVYSASIEVFNVYVRASLLITWRSLFLVGNCLFNTLPRVALTLGDATVELIFAVSKFLAGGESVLTADLQLNVTVALIGDAIFELYPAFNCTCGSLDPVINTTLSLFQKPTLHMAVDDTVNTAIKLVQAPVLAAVTATLPDVIPAFTKAERAITGWGNFTDDVIQVLFQDFAALIVPSQQAPVLVIPIAIAPARYFAAVSSVLNQTITAALNAEKLVLREEGVEALYLDPEPIFRNLRQAGDALKDVAALAGTFGTSVGEGANFLFRVFIGTLYGAIRWFVGVFFTLERNISDPQSVLLYSQNVTWPEHILPVFEDGESAINSTATFFNEIFIRTDFLDQPCDSLIGDNVADSPSMVFTAFPAVISSVLRLLLLGFRQFMQALVFIDRLINTPSGFSAPYLCTSDWQDNMNEFITEIKALGQAFGCVLDAFGMATGTNPTLSPMLAKCSMKPAPDPGNLNCGIKPGFGHEDVVDTFLCSGAALAEASCVVSDISSDVIFFGENLMLIADGSENNPSCKAFGFSSSPEFNITDALPQLNEFFRHTGCVISSLIPPLSGVDSIQDLRERIPCFVEAVGNAFITLPLEVINEVYTLIITDSFSDNSLEEGFVYILNKVIDAIVGLFFTLGIVLNSFTDSSAASDDGGGMFFVDIAQVLAVTFDADTVQEFVLLLQDFLRVLTNLIRISAPNGVQNFLDSVTQLLVDFAVVLEELVLRLFSDIIGMFLAPFGPQIGAFVKYVLTCVSSLLCNVVFDFLNGVADAINAIIHAVHWLCGSHCPYVDFKHGVSCPSITGACDPDNHQNQPFGVNRTGTKPTYCPAEVLPPLPNIVSENTYHVPCEVHYRFEALGCGCTQPCFLNEDGFDYISCITSLFSPTMKACSPSSPAPPALTCSGDDTCIGGTCHRKCTTNSDCDAWITDICMDFASGGFDFNFCVEQIFQTRVCSVGVCMLALNPFALGDFLAGEDVPQICTDFFTCTTNNCGVGDIDPAFCGIRGLGNTPEVRRANSIIYLELQRLLLQENDVQNWASISTSVDVETVLAPFTLCACMPPSNDDRWTTTGQFCEQIVEGYPNLVQIGQTFGDVCPSAGFVAGNCFLGNLTANSTTNNLTPLQPLNKPKSEGGVGLVLTQSGVTTNQRPSAFATCQYAYREEVRFTNASREVYLDWLEGGTIQDILDLPKDQFAEKMRAAQSFFECACQTTIQGCSVWHGIVQAGVTGDNGADCEDNLACPLIANSQNQNTFYCAPLANTSLSLIDYRMQIQVSPPFPTSCLTRPFSDLPVIITGIVGAKQQIQPLYPERLTQEEAKEDEIPAQLTSILDQVRESFGSASVLTMGKLLVNLYYNASFEYPIQLPQGDITKCMEVTSLMAQWVDDADDEEREGFANIPMANLADILYCVVGATEHVTSGLDPLVYLEEIRETAWTGDTRCDALVHTYSFKHWHEFTRLERYDYDACIQGRLQALFLRYEFNTTTIPLDIFYNAWRAPKLMAQMAYAAYLVADPLGSHPINWNETIRPQLAKWHVDEEMVIDAMERWVGEDGYSIAENIALHLYSMAMDHTRHQDSHVNGTLPRPTSMLGVLGKLGEFVMRAAKQWSTRGGRFSKIKNVFRSVKEVIKVAYKTAAFYAKKSQSAIRKVMVEPLRENIHSNPVVNAISTRRTQRKPLFHDPTLGTAGGCPTATQQKYLCFDCLLLDDIISIMLQEGAWAKTYYDCTFPVFVSNYEELASFYLTPLDQLTESSKPQTVCGSDAMDAACPNRRQPSDIGVPRFNVLSGTLDLYSMLETASSSPNNQTVPPPSNKCAIASQGDATGFSDPNFDWNTATLRVLDDLGLEEVGEFIDDINDWFIDPRRYNTTDPSEERNGGFLYTVEELFTCDYDRAINCIHPRMRSFTDGILATIGVFFVLIILFNILFPTFSFITLLAFLFAFQIFLFITYSWTPICAGLPVCLGNDFQLWLNDFLPPCIPWPESLLQNPNQGQLPQCTDPESPKKFIDCVEVTGIKDWTYGLMFLFKWQAPDVFDFLATTQNPLFTWYTQTAYFQQVVSTFEDLSDPPPDVYINCFWVLIFNTLSGIFYLGLLLILAGAGIFFVVAFFLLLPILWYFFLLVKHAVHDSDARFLRPPDQYA